MTWNIQQVLFGQEGKVQPRRSDTGMLANGRHSGKLWSKGRSHLLSPSFVCVCREGEEREGMGLQLEGGTEENFRCTEV